MYALPLLMLRLLDRRQLGGGVGALLALWRFTLLRLRRRHAENRSVEVVLRQRSIPALSATPVRLLVAVAQVEVPAVHAAAAAADPSSKYFDHG